jgi:hypothetical protein
MAPTPVTVLTPDGTVEVDGEVRGADVWLAPEAVHAALGWEPKPEGLCRGDLCVPVRDPDARDADGRLELGRVAAALLRPCAVEVLDDRVVASIGDAAHERAAALRGGTAPPLVLHDLEGRPVPIPGDDRRKRLLLAWSSW